MKQALPRMMIAGTSSGCGKTTVACAVMGALLDKGLHISAFKCGPDYIDPMFHTHIVGAPSRNLDLFLLEEKRARQLLLRHGRGMDMAVLEGVMGFYDGLGDSGTASSCHLAAATDTPVFLVASCKGMSRSLAAMVQGYQRFAPNTIRGIILNEAAPGGYPALKRLVEEYTGLPVLGYLPRMENAGLESRHLGLVTAEEVEGLREKVAAWVGQAKKTIDLDRMVKIAGQAPPLEAEPLDVAPLSLRVRVGVARDRAFCFYYQDSLDLLEQMGAELVEFSPLADSRLPENLDGLYLGGGYPELYLRQLSANIDMLWNIREELAKGLCCIAECGGFLYLHEQIADQEGTLFPMVGFIPGSVRMTERLGNFGYARVTAAVDTLLLPAGESVPVHEFHYSSSDNPGGSCTAAKENGKSWPCVHSGKRIWAGYPHLHFWSDPRLARRFLEACLRKECCRS